MGWDGRVTGELMYKGEKLSMCAVSSFRMSPGVLTVYMKTGVG